jgi:hypothetical protein
LWPAELFAVARQLYWTFYKDCIPEDAGMLKDVRVVRKHILMWAVLLQNEVREVQDKNSDYGPTSREYSAHSDFQHRQTGQGEALPSFPLAS